MNTELYHYGVRGQKWGVRRWQNKDGSLTPAGKARLRNWQGGTDVGRDLVKYASPGRKKAQRFIQNMAIYAATTVIPPLGLVIMSKNLVDINKYAFDGTDYAKKEGKYEKISDLKRKTQQYTPEQDVLLANPRLGNQKGKVNNCTLCTSAMELRSRGYDVIARSQGSGNDPDIYSKWFKGAERQTVDCTREQGESRKAYANRAYNKLCTEIEKQGPGASGYVGINWEKSNSGHAMWYKVGNDGKVTFYDGQNGKSGIKTDKTFALADPSQHEYTRLDNCALDPSVTESVRSNPKGEKK